MKPSDPSCEFTVLRRGFGVGADERLARLPPDVPTIACDAEGALLALAAAADERRAGRPFYVAPLLSDVRGEVAQRISGALLAQWRETDARRSVFDLLAREELTINNGPQAHVRLLDERLVRTLRDVVLMSDAVIARSTVDAERIARICSYRRRFVVAAPGADPSVPKVVSSARTSIVVWAPRLSADRLGVIAMGLATAYTPVVFVCASGTLPGVAATFVSPEQGAEALAQAGCVVDATIDDPATAIALAEIGVPVVAASTSGSAEFLDGVFTYDPWDYRSLNAAVARAHAGRAPEVARDPMPRERLAGMLARTTVPIDPNGPLVTIMLATYNRRSLLPIALDSIAAQSYTQLDVIVVNDAGVDVADICARYPFVRLVTMPSNVGYSAAVRAAMGDIRGAYFGFWADDDIMFPDHIARMVYALESSCLAVAHTQTLTCYFVDLPDGTRKTRAYKILHERPNDPIEMLTGPTMTFGSMLFRRSLLDEIGLLDPEYSMTDFEYQLRASQRYDFVAADAVTLQWNYNVEGKSFQHQMGVERMARDQLAIYARYPSDLQSVRDRRAAWQAEATANFGTVLWPPDQYLPDDFTG